MGNTAPFIVCPTNQWPYSKLFHNIFTKYAKVFVPAKPFQPIVIIVCKARAYPRQVLHLDRLTGLTDEHYTRLEGLARNLEIMNIFFCYFYNT